MKLTKEEILANCGTSGMQWLHSKINSLETEDAILANKGYDLSLEDEHDLNLLREVRDGFAKSEIEKIAQWVIDNRYPKSENDKMSDFEMYHELIEKITQLQQ
jgi:hypothetical protein